jgi:AcrR family transcriptional regulator
MSTAATPSRRRPYDSPLRERQAQQTRDGILDALVVLAGDRRADEITTRELARSAGVSERTVYRHFPDRTALVEALSARFMHLSDRTRIDLHRLEDLQPMVVELMRVLEAHHVEARAEAVLNADPRRYSPATRQHTEQFSDLVGVTFPDLDPDQQVAVAAVVRVLVSSQTWLRMREELGLTGERSGPVVAWAIGALMHEIERGSLPPA